MSAPAATQSLFKEVLGNLIAGGIATGFGAVKGGAAAALPETAAAPTASRGKGGYFVSPADLLNAQQYADQENYRRTILNKFGFGLPLLVVEDVLQGQVQRSEEQAESLGRRERAKTGLEKSYELASTGLTGQYGVEKAESEALGRIQQERVKSGYDTAQALLDSVIKNISSVPNFSSSPVLAELARVV